MSAPARPKKSFLSDQRLILLLHFICDMQRSYTLKQHVADSRSAHSW